MAESSSMSAAEQIVDLEDKNVPNSFPSPPEDPNRHIQLEYLSGGPNNGQTYGSFVKINARPQNADKVDQFPYELILEQEASRGDGEKFKFIHAIALTQKDADALSETNPEKGQGILCNITKTEQNIIAGKDGVLRQILNSQGSKFDVQPKDAKDPPLSGYISLRGSGIVQSVKQDPNTGLYSLIVNTEDEYGRKTPVRLDLDSEMSEKLKDNMPKKGEHIIYETNKIAAGLDEVAGKLMMVLKFLVTALIRVFKPGYGMNHGMESTPGHKAGFFKRITATNSRPMTQKEKELEYAHIVNASEEKRNKIALGKIGELLQENIHYRHEPPKPFDGLENRFKRKFYHFVPDKQIEDQRTAELMKMATDYRTNLFEDLTPEQYRKKHGAEKSLDTTQKANSFIEHDGQIINARYNFRYYIDRKWLDLISNQSIAHNFRDVDSYIKALSPQAKIRLDNLERDFRYHTEEIWEGKDPEWHKVRNTSDNFNGMYERYANVLKNLQNSLNDNDQFLKVKSVSDSDSPSEGILSEVLSYIDNIRDGLKKPQSEITDNLDSDLIQKLAERDEKVLDKRTQITNDLLLGHTEQQFSEVFGSDLLKTKMEDVDHKTNEFKDKLDSEINFDRYSMILAGHLEEKGGLKSPNFISQYKTDEAAAAERITLKAEFQEKLASIWGGKSPSFCEQNNKQDYNVMLREERQLITNTLKIYGEKSQQAIQETEQPKVAATGGGPSPR